MCGRKREPVQIYSDIADCLDKIEDDPASQQQMRVSDRAMREGRVTSHEKQSSLCERVQNQNQKNGDDASKTRG
jgi:hypothetical protein